MRITWLFPKGTHDCGNHDWYRSKGNLFHCYHCEAGTLESDIAPWEKAAGS